MRVGLTRRNLIASGLFAVSGVLLGGGRTARAGLFTGKIKKAVKYDMVKVDGPAQVRFSLVKSAGFDGIEVAVREQHDPDELRAASVSTGLPIHGVVNGSVNELGPAIDRAAYFGADSVLVVAGRVTARNSYAKNYSDTQAALREAAPYAERHKVRLLIENVWNDFLYSPVEMARYVDEIQSEAVGVYFDTGNVSRYGWPEQWVPILGSRIKKLDVRDFSRTRMFNEGPLKGFDVALGEGEVDFEAIRRELNLIGFTGWATVEAPSATQEQFAELAKRVDSVLELN